MTVPGKRPGADKMSFTSDPQNSITSISQMDDDDKTSSRQPQPFKDLSNHYDTPPSSQESQRGQKGAPSRIEFKLEVEEYREKFGYKSIEELVGLLPVQLAHQLFEAQALLHDKHLNITQTNRKRRMKEAEKKKEKKERRRRRRRSDQQVK